MGYYTYHTLSVYDENMNYLVEETEKQSELISEKVEGDKHFLFDDETKWYACDEDMLEHSKEYPDFIFCIYGDGEDRDDRWRAYYKNGKICKQEGRIEFDEFDVKSIL